MNSQVEIDNALWAATPTIALNHGLVAIVRARGSEKTVLASVIAAGGDAITEAGWNADEAGAIAWSAR